MTIRPRRSVLYMPGSNARALEKAQDPAGRRRDPRSRGRGRARRQGGGAPAGRGRGQGRRLRPPRGVHPRQRHRHAVDQRRHRRRRVTPRPDAILVPKCRRPSKRSRCSASACSTCTPTSASALGDDRDAGRDRSTSLSLAAAAHDSETRLDRLRHGHQRSRQGDARAAGARAARRWCRGWRAACSPRMPTASTCSTASTTTSPTPKGFERECAQGRDMGFDGKTLIHPEPDRALQRRVLAAARTKSRRRARSSPRSNCRRTRARAWCRSTAAWSRSCTPTWRGGPSRSPTRSRWRRRPDQPAPWDADGTDRSAQHLSIRRAARLRGAPAIGVVVDRAARQAENFDFRPTHCSLLGHRGRTAEHEGTYAGFAWCRLSGGIDIFSRRA